MINLASEDPQIIEDGMNRIRLSVDRGQALGASIVVFHSAYYTAKYTKDETYKSYQRRVRRFAGLYARPRH